MIKKPRKTIKKQLALDYGLDKEVFKTPPLEFGGSSLKTSHPKTARPITTKNAMHIVLRSSLAKGEYSLLSKNRRNKIISIINKNAHKFDIKIYELAVNSNHIHILLKLKFRDTYKKFIKAITGIVSRMVLGAEKGRAVVNITEKLKQFWDSRPFSKIVEWGKAYIEAKLYVVQNVFEAEGLIDYSIRNKINRRN